MSEQLKNPQLQVDLKNTTAFEDENGNKIFQQGFLLRKVSKFVAGTSEDAVMPIPVFYDPTNGKILGEGIPVELRDELKDELC